MTGLVKVPYTTAAYQTLETWQNLLMLGALASYAGRRFILPLCGKTCEQFPYIDRINTAFLNSFAFADAATCAASVYSAAQDVKAFYDHKKNNKDSIKIIKADNRDFPTDSHPVSKEAWLTYRVIGALLKTFSSAMLVWSTLKSIGVVAKGPSASMKALGAGLGIATCAIDFADKGMRLRENRVSKNKVSDAIKKDENEKEEFSLLFETNLRYSQAIKVTVIGMKTIVLISTLYSTETPGLLGKISRHSTDALYGFFAVSTTLSFAQHIYVGATVKQHTAKESKPSESKYKAVKYLATVLPDTREFIRLIEAVASHLVDLHLGEEIADFGALKSLAKNLDGFLYAPLFFKKAREARTLWKGVYKKGIRELNQENALKVYDAVFSTLKTISNAAGALKLLAALGVPYFAARYKGLTYLKNGLTIIISAADFIEEISNPSEKSINKKEVVRKKRGRSTPMIVIKVSSLFLNIFGSLELEILPAWIYNSLKLAASSAGIYENLKKEMS